MVGKETSGQNFKILKEDCMSFEKGVNGMRLLGLMKTFRGVSRLIVSLKKEVPMRNKLKAAVSITSIALFLFLLPAFSGSSPQECWAFGCPRLLGIAGSAGMGLAAAAFGLIPVAGVAAAAVFGL